jgi:hypothetical protein
MQPRPLTALEARTLVRLLPEGGFEGVMQYRAQAEHCMVHSMCPCGCATINLAVDQELAPRSNALGTPLLPIEGRAEDATGRPLELILFAADGWLSSLEIVYYSDATPREFPDPTVWETSEI